MRFRSLFQQIRSINVYFYVASYVLIMTIIVCLIIDLSRLYEWSYLNDQSNYMTAARNYLSHGVIEFNWNEVAFYDSAKRNYYYMPGYVLILAGTYYIFGFGVWQSMLPSVICFMASSVLVFEIGRILYGKKAGWISMVLFCTYRFYHSFAFVAFTESSLIASMMIAFYIFLRVNTRYKLLVGWCLPIIPFLFRETSAIILFPMCAVLLNQMTSSKKWIVVPLFALLSVVALSLVYVSPRIADRRSTFMMIILSGNGPEQEHEQVAQQKHWPDLKTLIGKLAERGAKNTLDYLKRVVPSVTGFEAMFYLAMIPIGILSFMYRRDYFMISCSLSVIITMLAIFCCYVLDSSIGNRNLLQLLPLVSLGYGYIFSRILNPRIELVGIVTISLFMFAYVIYYDRIQWKVFHDNQANVNRTMEAIEASGHNDKTMIVSPTHLVAQYLNKHYPVVSYNLPRKLEQLEWIQQRHHVTTIIMTINQNKDSSFPTTISVEDLRKLGYVLVRQFTNEGEFYGIYRFVLGKVF